MTRDAFLKAFGHFVDAPDGIKRLRELVLRLAVQGKLVLQDRNDEPASELIKRIQAEKRKQVTASDKNQQARFSELDTGELPFALPNGWAWIQFKNIALIERGGSPRPIKDYITEESTGLNWIKIGDTDIGGKYITSAKEKIRPEGLTKTRKVFPGDFLLTNSMSFGRPYITQIEGCIHDGWLRISPPKSLDKDYLYTLLSSSFVRDFFAEAASGAVVMNLNSAKVRELPIPLPPLAEQHRIVAKVDELMALCDQLEAEHNARHSTHTHLLRAVHHPLTEASDAASTATAWRRIRNHFADLYTTRESVQALRQTILQLAVQGKLVEQDPRDEPASSLLARVQSAVRDYRNREGIRLPATSEVTQSERPFPVSPGWLWARLDEICRVITDGDHQPPPRAEVGVSFLTIGNVSSGSIDFTGCRHVPKHYFDGISPYRKPMAGDILYTVVGATYGRPIVVETERPFCVQRHISLIKPAGGICLEYLAIFLRSPLAYEQATKNLTGTAQPTLPLRPLRNFFFPLPPLAEQHRIVTKVDELMALCNQLDAAITARDSTASHYAEAVVAHLTTEQRNQETSSFPRRRESMAH